MHADFQLAREGALGDLAVHGGAGQPSAGKYGFKADNSFEVGHGTCFHSLAVIGSPRAKNCRRQFAAQERFWGQ